MTSPRDFRQFALDCLHWAEETSDASQRQIFLDIAKLYMRVSVELDERVTIAPRGTSPLVDDLHKKLG
jgi:hypothetical protein